MTANGYNNILYKYFLTIIVHVHTSLVPNLAIYLLFGRALFIRYNKFYTGIFLTNNYVKVAFLIYPCGYSCSDSLDLEEFLVCGTCSTRHMFTNDLVYKYKE